MSHNFLSGDEDRSAQENLRTTAASFLCKGKGRAGSPQTSFLVMQGTAGKSNHKYQAGRGY